jgi:hypothetical protein
VPSSHDTVVEENSPRLRRLRRRGGSDDTSVIDVRPDLLTPAADKGSKPRRSGSDRSDSVIDLGSDNDADGNGDGEGDGNGDGKDGKPGKIGKDTDDRDENSDDDGDDDDDDDDGDDSGDDDKAGGQGAAAGDAIATRRVRRMVQKPIVFSPVLGGGESQDSVKAVTPAAGAAKEDKNPRTRAAAGGSSSDSASAFREVSSKRTTNDAGTGDADTGIADGPAHRPESRAPAVAETIDADFEEGAPRRSTRSRAARKGRSQRRAGRSRVGASAGSRGDSRNGNDNSDDDINHNNSGGGGGGAPGNDDDISEDDAFEGELEALAKADAAARAAGRLTTGEIALFDDAVTRVPLSVRNYWQQISKIVGRSADVCRAHRARVAAAEDAGTRAAAAAKEPEPSPEKIELEDIARAGPARKETLRRKYLERKDHEHDDDLFDATPMKGGAGTGLVERTPAGRRTRADRDFGSGGPLSKFLTKTRPARRSSLDSDDDDGDGTGGANHAHAGDTGDEIEPDDESPIGFRRVNPDVAERLVRRTKRTAAAAAAARGSAQPGGADKRARRSAGGSSDSDVQKLQRALARSKRDAADDDQIDDDDSANSSVNGEYGEFSD